MDDEERFFDQVAKRFFSEFLELKIQLQSGKLAKPKNYDQELAQYQRANAQLKKSCEDLAQRNGELEEALGIAEEKAMDIHRQLNEALIELGIMQERYGGLGLVDNKPAGTTIWERLSDESRKELEKLMREIPYRGNKDG